MVPPVVGEKVERYPDMPEDAPADYSDAIAKYFETVEHEHCDREDGALAPFDADALGADELRRTLGELDALVHALNGQRAAIARRRIIEIEAELTGDRESDSVPSERVREVEMLLEAVLLGEAEEHRAHRQPTCVELEVPTGKEDPHPARTAEAIIARLRAELPRREFRRRIRWSIPALTQIIALNEASPVPLAPDQRRLREEITANAIALIAARRTPGGDETAEPSAIAQVAYLVPVEVFVDLDADQVQRVVVIDEAIELDPEEGARAEISLTALTLAQARRAIAIAERNQAWPASQSGF